MNSDRFMIEGGVSLRGEVQVSGSKNAALPIIAAALLTREDVIIDNLPLIEDIRHMLSIVESLGAEVELDEDAHSVRIRAKDLRSYEIPPHLGTIMRASFLAMGPLLARTGRGVGPMPGGCAIGRRPVNVDVNGFEAMGAHVEHDGQAYHIKADRLHGARMYLDYPSVTGTEDLLMAASLAKGKTVIKHAATEPEVIALAECLTRMGARIRGAGTSLIEVDGVGELYGVHLRCQPDRIEAGTFLVAGLITGGDVTVQDVVVPHLDPIIHKLAEVGAIVEEGETSVRVCANGHLQGVELQTLHYPGFPTDLQSVFTTLLTQCAGTSLVHERVFDNRLAYVKELNKLGAHIRVTGGQTAEIDGPTPLTGGSVRASDLRAGAALIVAGLAAGGTTEINDIYHVDRGYEAVDTKLRALGARIERVPAKEAVAASA